ncbi:unnamed protein product [Fraxinus pennsylvanica]|uniref:Arogenate dehydratase n=1 Tax=Fraxinus pennsylvanica TaxID=56036 RepID=A0AAD1YS83_9LAMI|nr:unnamed protein product [Fraxinus pennsylvanica]
MALKVAPIWVYSTNDRKNFPFSELGFSDLACTNGGNTAFLNLRLRRNWECLSVFSQRATTPVEDEIPLTPGIDAPGGIEKATQIAEGRRFHKDLNSLPIKAYPECETVPCDQFEAAFKAVELWLVDKAVLPIENSVGGSIHRNYDLLLRHRLHIVGEVKLKVNHCLLGLPGVRKEELKHVLSHPQALDQCEITLNKLGVTRVSAEDSAGAAQVVASGGVRDTGAVASARAAEIYGLDILDQGIQDDSDNITRFLILAREPIIPGTDRPFKTSIVFTLEEGPGILFKALAVFALRDINLSKIESRPQKRRPLRVVDDSNKGRATYFDYLFYIDFEASMVEPRAQYALGHLQEFARFLRVLGCYPIDTVK